MKIGIFCSANEHIDRDYFLFTEALGRWIAQHGHTIVYGGVNQGLMECVARAAKQAGGHTIGVVPSIVEQSGRVSAYNDEIIPCQTLNERIQLMIQRSDVFIALPGGIGTLDELFSVASSHTIGYHHKRLILFNMKGFWEALIHTLDDLQARGMIRQHWNNYIQVANSLEDIARLLDA